MALCPSAKKPTFEQTKTDSGTFKGILYIQWHLFELLALSFGKEADL
jgi:hypothetical protein